MVREWVLADPWIHSKSTPGIQTGNLGTCPEHAKTLQKCCFSMNLDEFSWLPTRAKVITILCLSESLEFLNPL